LVFPTYYLVESGFSWVTYLLSEALCEERWSSLVTGHTAAGHSNT